MKKLLLAAIIFLFAGVATAQTEVTKFLGIPVDGTKGEVMAKLRAKGFKTSPSMGSEYLEGVFNGTDVYVTPLTHNNKVYRIAVIYKYAVNEIQIKRAFNNLCSQFSASSKYEKCKIDQTITENQNISYEIDFNSKQFEAYFFQRPYDINKVVWFTIEKYDYDQYRILMFYENLYNQANGEDL